MVKTKKKHTKIIRGGQIVPSDRVNPWEDIKIDPVTGYGFVNKNLFSSKKDEGCNCEEYNAEFNNFLKIRKMYHFRMLDRDYLFSNIFEANEVFVSSVYLTTTLFTESINILYRYIVIEKATYDRLLMEVQPKHYEWYLKYVVSIVFNFSNIFILRKQNTRIRLILDWITYQNLSIFDRYRFEDGTTILEWFILQFYNHRFLME